MVEQRLMAPIGDQHGQHFGNNWSQVHGAQCALHRALQKSADFTVLDHARQRRDARDQL